MPCFRILTDVIYIRRDESKVDQFYGGFERVDNNSRTTASSKNHKKSNKNRAATTTTTAECWSHQRCWIVGDLCAFYQSGSTGPSPPKSRNPPLGFPSQLIDNPQITIGQILALRHSRTTTGQSTYHAVVRQLVRCDKDDGDGTGDGTVQHPPSAAQPTSRKRRNTSASQSVPTTKQHVLIETLETELLDLSSNRLLEHIQVRLLEPSSSLGQADGAEIPTTAPRGGLHPNPIEPNGWIWSFRQVHSPRHENGSLGQIVPYDKDWQQLDPAVMTPIPMILQRGWKCLMDRELVQAMTAKWPMWTVPVRQVVQALSFKHSQSENPVTSSQPRKRPKTNHSAPPTSSKRGRRKADENCDDGSTMISNSIDSEAAQAPTHQGVITPSTPLSHPPTVYHLKRNSKNNRYNPLTTTTSLRFYTEFQVSTDPIVWAGLSRKAPKPIAWSISIGDVLIVACDPTEVAATRNPMSWCQPFPVPWAVGQVVSLYRPDPSHTDAAHDNDSPSDDDAPWMMELRWFYRLHELRAFEELDIPPHLHRWSLVESDEHVTRVPVHMALGRACFTSTPPAGRSNHRIDADGVVTVSFVCRDLFMLQYDEKQLRPIADWDKYGSQLSGPLSRGLLCEKAWPGRSDAKRLQKVYTQYMMKKYRLDSHVMDCGFPVEAKHAMEVEPSQESSVCEQSDSGSNGHDNLHLSEIDLGQSQVLGTMIGLELYHSVLVQPRQKRFENNTAARSVSSKQWRLSPGYCVCLATSATHSNDQPSDSTGRNPWSPFHCPWQVVQILSVYRKLSDPAEKPKVLLEVRPFARTTELTTRVRSSLFSRHDDGLLDDEILETDTVEIDIPACRILGPCTVHSAHCFLPAMESTAHGAIVQRRVRFLYQSIRQRILPVFSMTPKSWSKAMLRRGLSKSKLLQSDSSLATTILSNFDTGSLGTSNGLFASLPTDKATPQLLWKSVWRSVPVAPLWTCISEADILCPREDRSGLHWVVEIGDVIAVRVKGDGGSGSDRFPFTVSWKPCQVLAILSASSLVPSQAQVRWLSHTFPADGSSDIGMLFDGDDAGRAALSLIELSDCLGPITLTTETMAPISLGETPPFVPLTFMKFEAKGIDSSHDLLASIVRRGIHSCPLYSEAEKVDAIRILGCDVVQAPPLNHQQENESPGTADGRNTFRSLSYETPIVEDATSGIRFYSRLFLKRKRALNKASDTRRNFPTTWTVKLGDTVAVNVTRRVGGPKRGKKEDMLPFLVPWQVAEVVTIFQQGDKSKNEDDVQLEVRWFYHGRDLAGRIKGGTLEVEDEVVETDHLEVVSPSKLLAHVALEDHFQTFDAEASLRYTCRQFWSCYSNSLVPTGSLDNRINRGRAHSNFFGKYPALQVACRSLGRCKDPKPTSESHESPTTSFQRVIEKLSLTDASKEALHQTSGIIGRDPERRYIASFLRAALEGKGDEGKLNATLFVAGPPGVGKTACVRATLNELQREREAAKSPKFDFFVLNGMELRNPLDAYSKFWEDVSPNREQCSSDRAASMLANYFTNKGHGGRACKGRIVVLLVDELDYLVTKKQNVLYDLFNWPTEARGDRRLIVIGVSNTVNLPERLHPRVQSRIGSKRCYFKSYSAKELAAILETKARAASPHYQVFDDDAITFVSKKIAALSGDVRKAFKICRSAAENVLAQPPETAAAETASPPKPPRVYIKDVVKVCRDSFHSAQANGLALCSSYEALFLVALTSLSKWTGRERGGFDMEEIVVKMEAMSNSLGDRRYQPAPTLTEALYVASRLGEARLVSLRSPRDASLSHHYTSLSESGGPWPLVSLAIDDSAVLVALKDTADKELVHTFLRSGGRTGSGTSAP